MDLPYPVVLASASPRRKELLSELIAEFEVVPAEIDEKLPTRGNPEKIVTTLAREKAVRVAAMRPDSLVIAGDTVVALPIEGTGESLIFSKPADREAAARMLAQLSGRTHLVITGICLNWPNRNDNFSVTTKVTFRKLSDSEIRAYVNTGEPLDKAGAYAIQGGAKDFVESIEGSISNVIGLPLEKLKQALESIRSK